MKELNELDNVKINESFYDLNNGNKGTVAVLMYTGSADPKVVLDDAVRIYTSSEPYHEFIDANLDNPWTRVIMSDINGMNQRDFDKNSDKMKKMNKKESITYDKYSLLIDAVCYWLGFQVKIGREKLIHEASLRYPIADAITSGNTSISQIKLEESHPLFKSKRIDLVIHENKEEKLLQEIYEFKIAKYTTNESDEHQRVFDDVIRLAYFHMIENKDCYFLMCGSYDNFKQDFVGDKIIPNTEGGKVIIPGHNNTIRGWNSGGLYKDWFEFTKGKKKEKVFSISDSKNEWGLKSFKNRYELRNEITSKEFYNSDSITIITECMAITPYGADKTHAAGIWKIKAK